MAEFYPAFQKCIQANCNKPSYARGWCNGHYIRWQKGRPLEPPIADRSPGKICIEDGCGRLTAPHGGHDRCKRHYTKWLRAERTMLLVVLLGDACIRCHNSYPEVVYDFHHRDPASKLFAIGQEITNRSMEELEAEALKCDLLCANCHRVVHFG